MVSQGTATGATSGGGAADAGLTVLLEPKSDLNQFIPASLLSKLMIIPDKPINAGADQCALNDHFGSIALLKMGSV